MARAVGIDLGTTYTAVAVVDEYGKPTVLKNGDGDSTTPSVVYIDHPHYIVGEVALQSTLTEPERVVQFVKRSMGLPEHRIVVDGRAFSPEFISSVILRKVVSEAQAQLGELVTDVVITVPTYFSKAQRQATLEAGELAGLNVLRLINEPTAAALAYGVAHTATPTPHHGQGPQARTREVVYRGQRVRVPVAPRAGAGRDITYRGQRLTVGATGPSAGGHASIPSGRDDADARPSHVLVYDLGGGTFDVTILGISERALEVVAVGGESHLGGKDFDDLLMNFIESEFEKSYGAPLAIDASLEAELRLKAENAKRQLSSRPSVPITFKTRVSDPNTGRESVLPARIEVSRAAFETLSLDLITRTQICLENVLADCALSWSEIDQVLCVGGASRMPMVREMLTRLSGRAPLLHDPDECVAKGAAIQAHLILSEAQGEATSQRITHVLPHTLGVATARGSGAIVEPIVPALTPLPCVNAREEFTTTLDNQTQVSVLVYEGEARDPGAYPRGPIGVFHLDTTPPRPRGVPRIRVEFRCDENGRIIALARDQETGKESRAFIHLGSSRTDAETRLEAAWLSEALIA